MSEPKSLHVCGCGWSNVTTYRGLRIHQGKSKCGFNSAVDQTRGSPRQLTWTSSPSWSQPSSNSSQFERIFSTEPLQSTSSTSLFEHVFVISDLTSSTTPREQTFAKSRMDIASSRSANNLVPTTPKNIYKCSFCRNVLITPFTTTCNRTICRTCWDIHDQACSQCAKQLRPSPVTTTGLKTHQKRPEVPSPEQFTGQPGEVGCDVCSDNGRKKAVKSCLMCSMSYCGQHVEKHQKEWRLKGHQLVAPHSEMEQWVCKKHGRLLELYCLTEDQCICSLCVQEGMKVVPVEKERERKQGTLDAVIKDKEHRIKQREKKLNELDRSAANCLDLINQEKAEIQKVFGAIMRAVKRAEEEALGPLEDRRRQMETELKELKEELKREISLVQKLTDHQKITDPISYLQKFPSNTTSNNTIDWTDVTVDMDLIFGTMRGTRASMMAEIELELEKLCRIETQRIQKFAVNVSLDPDTANPQLLISDDLREVRGRKGNGAGSSAAAPRPGGFDLFYSVLGQNRLSGSRSFWVVDVGYKRGWDIGVVRDKANRKGQISFKPSQGYWAIVHYDGDQYSAMEDPPVLLSLPEKPRKVGVFVDYAERLVCFYDMEAKAHLYSFTNCTFRGVIRPYFSPHPHNQQPLIICPTHLHT